MYGEALILTTLLICSGLANASDVSPDTQSTPSSTQNHTIETFDTNHAHWTINDIRISDTRNITNPDKMNYEYFIRKNEGKWEITHQANLNDDQYESIKFDSRNKTFLLGFSQQCSKGNIQSSTECSCPKGLMSKSRKNNGYSLCTSAFRTPSIGVINAASTTLTTALTFWTGTTIVVYKVDTDAIRDAVKEAGIIDAINDEYYHIYQTAFNQAKSSYALASFISTYKNKFDPDGLVEQAEEKKVVAETLEAQIAQQKQQALELAKAEAQATRMQAKKQVEIETATWRKRITIGDETFCGPVIEIRQPMIHISLSSPLREYPGDLWLNISDVYPASVAGCRNINNQLSPIYSY